MGALWHRRVWVVWVAPHGPEGIGPVAGGRGGVVVGVVGMGGEQID